VDPVAPEVLGSVVTPVRALLYRGRLLATLQLPATPGTYRLVTTVHGADGVAFDAATQALVPAVAVRVSRPLSAAFGVVPTLTVEAGAGVSLAVRVVNDGAVAWADRPDPAALSEEVLDPRVTRAHPSARLVARWVPLATAGPEAPAPPEASASVAVDPGSQQTVRLALVAPAVPGSYLLVLDIDSPLHGSLAASGVGPGQVRVTVQPAATPEAP
jgi:hypothetical protein